MLLQCTKHLDAYRKDNYDNLTLKYDFSAEGQAIANMYESSTNTVNAYNATLTADGDYANGKGNGWMPTDQPAEYRLGEMFTNDEGIFRVEGLPYGQYLVVETTIPKDVFQCDPFIVTVDANSPQSRFTIPAGSVTTPSSDYMTYNILDEELEGYLQLIKIDTETGKAVKIANTSFALYKLDDKGNKTRISMIDPASGSATKKTDVFYTDADGLMKTPRKNCRWADTLLRNCKARKAISTILPTRWNLKSSPTASGRSWATPPTTWMSTSSRRNTATTKTLGQLTIENRAMS